MNDEPIGVVDMPNVVDCSRADAVTALERLGLNIDTVTELSATVPTGRVISQEPAPGSAVQAASTVRLTMSSGPPTSDVLTVVGRDSSRGSDESVRGLVKRRRQVRRKVDEAKDSISTTLSGLLANRSEHEFFAPADFDGYLDDLERWRPSHDGSDSDSGHVPEEVPRDGSGGE